MIFEHLWIGKVCMKRWRSKFNWLPNNRSQPHGLRYSERQTQARKVWNYLAFSWRHSACMGQLQTVQSSRVSNWNLTSSGFTKRQKNWNAHSKNKWETTFLTFLLLFHKVNLHMMKEPHQEIKNKPYGHNNILLEDEGVTYFQKL